MANENTNTQSKVKSPLLFGRTVIYSKYQKADITNIIEILKNAYEVHLNNLSQIEYLIGYYKGNQPILQRVKSVRPEINNMVVENHANEIVQFKTGYLLEKPIQYVARKDEVDDKSIEFLNDCMLLENKESKDKSLANYQAICGTAYRLCLPNRRYDGSNSPFNIYNISPRNSFVVYSTAIGNPPLVGVVYYSRKNANGDEEVVIQAYTETEYFEYIYGKAVLERRTNHIYGGIPLVEYPFNDERIGAFEIVISLLDSINLVESNRVDGVEQFIQSLLVFKNVDITKGDLKELLELGAIKINDNGEIEANVQYLVQELNQEQVQKLKDDMLEVVYKIAGLPSRATTGSGDTGSAVIYRNGWEEAEARTQETELIFKGSEREFLKFVLRYTRILTSGKYVINLGDIEIKFTRRNYENTMQKAQILDLMLKNPKIAPRLAFTTCGLFMDSENAFKESEEYYKAEMEKQKQTQQTPPAQEVITNENQ